MSLVRSRFVVLIAMFAIWIPVAGLVLSGRTSRTEVEDVIRRVDSASPSWEREDLYYHTVTTKRNVYFTGLLGEYGAADVHQNAERLRILVIGDSFTYGVGVRDMQRRWGDLLEDEINRRLGDGVAEVSTLAHRGLSTYGTAMLLDSIRTGEDMIVTISPEALQELRGEFDVVVLGYVHNDPIPLGIFDDQVTPALQDAAEAVAPGFVAKDRLEDVEHGLLYTDDPNPNQAYFEGAITMIRSYNPQAPAIWLPLPISVETEMIIAKQASVFERYGFTIAATKNATEIIDRYADVELMVTPIDYHPNTLLLTAYARDGADAVLSTISGARIEAARAATSRVIRDPIGSYLPLEMQFEMTGEEMTITNPNSRSIDHECILAGGMGNRTACPDGPLGQAHYYIGGTNLGGELVDISPDSEVSAQYMPCTPLGRAFAQVNFDRMHPSDTRLNISVFSVESGATLIIYAHRYDEEGIEHFDPLGNFAAGDTFELLLDDGVNGLVIAHTESTGCSLDFDDSPWLPDFTLKVKGLNTIVQSAVEDTESPTK